MTLERFHGDNQVIRKQRQIFLLSVLAGRLLGPNISFAENAPHTVGRFIIQNAPALIFLFLP
jgi:hypothetical protein